MRIFDLDSWNEVFDTISRNKKRSVFTALGVVWGTFMLIILLGVGNGFALLFKGNVNNLVSNSILLYSGTTSMPWNGLQSGRLIEFDKKDVMEISRMQGIDGVMYLSPQKFGEIVYDNNTYDGMTLFGTTERVKDILSLKPVYGRLLNGIDDSRSRRVCIIPIQYAESITDNPEELIGKSIVCEGISIVIAGIYEKYNNTLSFSLNSRTLYMPYSTYTALYGKGEDRINIMIADVDRKYDSEEMEKKAKGILAANHDVNPEDKEAIYSLSLSFVFDKVNGFFDGFKFLVWVVGLGSLLAGVVGINNILLIVVRERRQEIGVRRAIGAKPSSIMGQIIAESCVMTIAAGMIGLMLAIAVTMLLDKYLLPQFTDGSMSYFLDRPLTFQLAPGYAMLCMGIIVLMSVVIGILPAWKALSIKAIDALREE